VWGQPESDFILRLDDERHDGISAALFEADGGAWQVQALERVRQYLTTKLTLAVVC